MQAPTEESFGFAERFLCPEFGQFFAFAIIRPGQENEPIVLAGDFTHLPKSGKQIPQRHCMRDPLSPPFHVNLIYGLRFFQAG
jgi:hypothetical protein